MRANARATNMDGRATVSRLLLAALALADARETPSGPWTPRSLASYAKARSGTWRGRGRLTNTLTGARIAEVDYLEETTAAAGSAATDADAAFGSRRVLVYRTADGEQLAQPLDYAHNVTVRLSDGNLLLRAGAPDGSSVVASGWGVGRGPLRVGLRRVYELSVRPVAKDAASDTPAPVAEAPAGWPRTAQRNALGTTREEYRLLGALRPGGRRTLVYKRTGRCPTWYGAGVCTLEVEAAVERRPAWRPRFLRPRRRADDEAGDGAHEQEAEEAE